MARPAWRIAKRVLALAFFALIAWLLVHQARAVEWAEVFGAIRGYGAATLLLAAALAACSYALYCSYDLMGRRYAGHRLAARKVLAITFISYAYNLNFGALVGGFAFRFRLYSRYGLGSATVARVLSLSLATNWLGYFCVGGLVFLLRPLALPPDWKLGSEGLRLLGAALLAAALAYLLLCALARKRTLSVRGHAFTLPAFKVAATQAVLSSLNWMLIAGVVFVLLQQRIAYPSVLAVLLVAAVAGVITHVPAGLGVLEAVFVTLLGHQLPQHQLLAALLTYRAIYYLAPLLPATVLFAGIELRARRARRAQSAPPQGRTAARGGT